jgi:hypothetical protein
MSKMLSHLTFRTVLLTAVLAASQIVLHDITGGLVPVLRGCGCPSQELAPRLIFEDVVGGAVALVPVSLASASLPFYGGTLLVDPNTPLSLSLAMGGTPGVAGEGGQTLPAFLPNDPLLDGLSIHLRAVIPDAGASFGYALSAGLEMAID